MSTMISTRSIQTEICTPQSGCDISYFLSSNQLSKISLPLNVTALAAAKLAGVIKGTGIAGMKEFNVIGHLRTACEDKKKFETWQGVMFTFETLFNTLGRLFEPYITYALPLFLTSFGDLTMDVCKATQDAAQQIQSVHICRPCTLIY